jgi:hypothetical protein
MAVTKAAVKTKITETFTITASNGDTYQVQEHTRYEVTKSKAGNQEHLGRAYYKTEDGRGVLKNADDNTYTIPSLGVKASR